MASHRKFAHDLKNGQWLHRKIDIREKESISKTRWKRFGGVISKPYRSIDELSPRMWYEVIREWGLKCCSFKLGSLGVKDFAIELE